MKKDWFENSSVMIFIDTSVIMNLGFNLNHKYFQTIKLGVENGDLTVVTTDILKGEFLKHCDEILSEDKAHLRKPRAARNFLDSEVLELERKINALSSADVWGQFENQFKPKDISTDVDWRLIFVKYFKSEPPFNKGSKKNEFPDAFNIELLEKLTGPAIVLSSDGDFGTWESEEKKHKLFKNIGDFTDEYISLREPEFTKECKDAFKVLEADIIEKLKVEHGEDESRFRIFCAHSEIERSEISELSLQKYDIIAFNKEDGFAVFKCWFSGEAELDLNVAVYYYDSEDKKDVIWGWNKKTAKVELNIEATITVTLLADETCEFDIEESQMWSESFDVPPIWTAYVDGPFEGYPTKEDQ